MILIGQVRLPIRIHLETLLSEASRMRELVMAHLGSSIHGGFAGIEQLALRSSQWTSEHISDRSRKFCREQ